MERKPIPPPPPDTATIFTPKELCGFLRIRERYLYELRTKDITFPEPFLVGANEQLRWRKSDVLAWFEALQRGWAQRKTHGRGAA